ncbi:MAG: hypothetical protein ACLTW9_00040 [Enterocloster sp.]
MKKTLRWLDVNFEAILMVLFFSLMILLVTVQVVLRFIFKQDFPGARKWPGCCLYGCPFPALVI